MVLPPDQPHGDPATRKLTDQVVREYGQSGRTFKSALIFAVPEASTTLQDEARKLLAWEAISQDDDTIKRLEEGQRRQLDTQTRKAARDLKEAVWRAYKYVLLLGRDNTLQEIDLGLVNSSAANSMVELILNRLRERDEITETVGASKLVKSWPPALKEWTTKAARDAFFASPSLPRLLKPEAIKRTIADGVNQRLIAYAGKTSGGGYDPLIFEPDTGLVESDIEISDDMVLLRAEDARMHQEPARLTRLEVHPASVRLKPDEGATFSATGFDQHDREMPISGVEWSATSGQIDPQGRFVADAIGDCQVIGRVGDLEGVAKVCVTRDGDPDETVVVKGVGWRGSVPPQKWMNFYTKVLTSLVSMPGLNLEVHFEIPPDESVTDDRIEAIRSALRDLGLSEDLRVTKREG